MRSRTFVGAVLLVVLLAPGLIATRGDRAGPARQWAAVWLAEPTLIQGVIVQGPVLFVHDDEKMARGGPCTSIRLFEPERGPAEEIAAFHCIPRPREVVSRFTIRTQPNLELGYGCILIEYQFAGDREGHGVPMSANAH